MISIDMQTPLLSLFERKMNAVFAHKLSHLWAKREELKRTQHNALALARFK